MNWTLHVNLWHAAAGNLWRQRGKTVAVFVPLLVAVTLFAAFNFVRDGMQKDALLSADAMPDLTVQTLIGGRPDRVPVALGQRIAAMRDVARVAPRVWGYVPLVVGGVPLTYVLMGIDINAMPRPEAVGLAVENGRFLNKGDADAAVVGKGVTEGLNVAAGQELVLKDNLGNAARLRVVGAFTSDVQLYTVDTIVVPIQTARRYFGYRPDECTDLCVYVSDSTDAAAVAKDIRALAPTTRVLTRDGMRDLTRNVYGRRAGIFQVLWFVLLLAGLLAAWAEASNTSLRASREIGILKATGWSTTNIIEMRVFESAIVALAATFGGMLLGLVYVWVGAPGIKSYFLGWAVIYPAMNLPIQVGAATVATVLAVGIFPLLVATVIPAWAAGITDPDEAMRS